MCNNSVITNEGLRGQPTEGALVAAALKVSWLKSACDTVCDRQRV